MASKKDTRKNATRWTEIEFQLFAEFLADPENNFAVFFGEIATKNVIQ